MKRPAFVSVLLILTNTLLLGQSNPIPLLSQPLVPASAAPGGKGFTLNINGTGFTSNAEVYWNGSLRPSTVVSSSQVQAQISAADIAKPGFGWVAVGNLGIGEVQSNVVYFPIRTAAKGVGFLPRSIQNITNNPGPIAVGDFNNDGLLDFAVASGKTIQVFLGKGNGTFQPPVVTTLKITTVLTMTASDFNGDGKLDLAVMSKEVNHLSPIVNAFLGKGDGTFTKKTGVFLDKGIPVLSAADFEGAGTLDLYFVSFDSEGDCLGRFCFGILQGKGDGTFEGSVGHGTYPLHKPKGPPAIGDFDGDGKLDIAVAGTNSSGKGLIDVYLSNGGYHLVSYFVPFAGDSVATADVNGDGKLDLVTEGVSVLLGNGDGTFRKSASIPSGAGGSINVGDFNGDGKLDIAAGLSILLGNGDGTFHKPLTFAGMESGFPISVGGFVTNGQLSLLGIDAIKRRLVHIHPASSLFHADQS